MTDKTKRELIDLAELARSGSYSPYSNFSVGAAIRTGNGKIYTGANVENASFGLTICAERSAALKAVNDGQRSFKMIACVGGPSDQTSSLQYCSPCGACRQFLFEFIEEDGETEIIGVNGNSEIVSNLLVELLPKAFGPKNLK